MAKLTELKTSKLSITTDEELEAWKATWDGESYPPPEVHRYMNEVVFPREEKYTKELVQWMKRRS